MDPNNIPGQTSNQQPDQPVQGFVPPQQQQQPVVQTPPAFNAAGPQADTQIPQFPQDHQIIKSSDPHHGSHKAIVVMFILIVLIAASVYVVIMFKSGSGNEQSTVLNAPPTPVVSTPTSIPTPVLNQEEQETDAIDVGTSDSGLQEIDQDVQNL